MSRNTLSNFDPRYFSAQLTPQISGGSAYNQDPTYDPNAGNFLADQYINGVELLPATYTNGIIFPRGAACSQAQAVSPFVTCSPFGKYVNPNYNGQLRTACRLCL